MFEGDGLRGLTSCLESVLVFGFDSRGGQDPSICNLKVSIKIFDLT